MPVLGDLLEPEDHRQDRDQRHRGARQVQPAGVGSRYSGRHDRAEHQQQAPSPAGPAGTPSPTRSARAGARRARARSALPAENAAIQTPIAIVRCCGSWNMVKISDRVDGASVAPAMPSSARLAISISGLVENAASSDATPNAAAPIEQQLAPADPVAERAHRDQEARDHEAVDVDDPEQLGAARLEVRADLRHGEVQHGQVHHVEEAARASTAKPGPFPTGRSRRYHVLVRCLSHRSRSFRVETHVLRFAPTIRLPDCPGLIGDLPVDRAIVQPYGCINADRPTRLRPHVRRPGGRHPARHRPPGDRRRGGRRRAGQPLPDELRGRAEARRGPRAGRPGHQGAHRAPQGRPHQRRGAARGAPPARPVRGAVARAGRPHDRRSSPATRRPDR